MSFLVTRFSASLPRKPMRVTLFWNMVFLRFCPVRSGHRSQRARVRAAPKARAAFAGRGPKLALGKESGKSRSPQPAGRSYSAEAVPERKGVNGKPARTDSDGPIARDAQEAAKTTNFRRNARWSIPGWHLR